MRMDTGEVMMMMMIVIVVMIVMEWVPEDYGNCFLSTQLAPTPFLHT